MNPLGPRFPNEHGPDGQLRLTGIFSDGCHDAELCAFWGGIVSRRKFIGQAAGGLGSILVAGLWLPRHAHAAGSTPKPIHGGIKFPLTGRFIHHYPIERGRQPSDRLATSMALSGSPR